MNSKTRNLTEGAMMTAFFAMLLIINRYTGRVFEEFLAFIMPIPMTAYAIKHKLRDCLPVLAAMCLITFVSGNITGIIYRFTQALIGLVFGTCLNRKTDSTKTFFMVVIMSVISVVLNTVLIAMIFGYNLQAEVLEMQKATMEMMTTRGMVLPEGVFTENYFMKVVMISVVLTGIVQGIITYVLGLLILKRLGFPVEKPKSVYYYYPPRISGWFSMFGFLAYMYTATAGLAEPLNSILQVIGICASLYLVVFGFMFLMFLLKTYLPNVNKALRGIGGLLLTICFMQFIFVMGFMYISGDWHRIIMEKGSMSYK